MILLDTNPLVYAINKHEPQHLASRSAVNASLARNVPGVLVPQVVLEFVATVSNPRKVARPLSPVQAWREATILQRSLPILNLESASLEILGQLLLRQPRRGQAIFDLFLVAQMRSHGIGQICTYNTADFRGILGIEPLTPEETLKRYGIPFTS